MTYWFTDPFIKSLVPLATATAVRGVYTTFLLPKMFIGTNALGEALGPLPGAADVFATTCSKKRAFIITDEHAGRYSSRVASALQSRQFTTQVWNKAQPEAPLETVKECGESMTEFEPDLIVAVGGGSVMDTAKASWILYERPDLADLASISPMTPIGLRKKAFLVAIPTTSGTGSDCTMLSVVTDTVAHRKIPILHPELLPDFAVLVPAFASGMPPKLTAGTGLDALAHAIDCIMSPASNDFTDALASRATQMVFKYLPKAYHNGADPEARLRMHIAASMAGIAFGNGGIGLTHSLGHSLGGLFNIHHGVAVGFFIPYTLQFYYPITEKYLDICEALGIRGNSKKANLAALVTKVRALLKDLDIPPDLKGFGISKGDFEKNMDKLVLYAVEDPAVFQAPRPITLEQCEVVFRYAFEGKDVDF